MSNAHTFSPELPTQEAIRDNLHAIIPPFLKQCSRFAWLAAMVSDQWDKEGFPTFAWSRFQHDSWEMLHLASALCQSRADEARDCYRDLLTMIGALDSVWDLWDEMRHEVRKTRRSAEELRMMEVWKDILRYIPIIYASTAYASVPEAPTPILVQKREVSNGSE